MLGLNPLEQEILDLTNEVARNGFIYFPAFCKAVHSKYREEDENLFRQNMFKVSCVDSIIIFICLLLKLSFLPYSCLWFLFNLQWTNNWDLTLQVLCGTKPFSDKFKAKKYKLQDQYLLKKDFVYIMKNLPEEVKKQLYNILWIHYHFNDECHSLNQIL